jgi:hypothetical protein
MKLNKKILIFLSIILALSIAFFIYGIQFLHVISNEAQSPSASSIIPAESGIQSSSVIPAKAGIQSQTVSSSTTQNCDIKQITDTVHGGSMSGIVEDS